MFINWTFTAIVEISSVVVQESKALLLLPDELRPHPLSPSDQEWIAANGGEEVTHTVRLTYPESYSHTAILRALLPESVKDVPSGFEAVGHIAHFNLREDVMPYKTVIGERHNVSLIGSENDLACTVATPFHRRSHSTQHYTVFVFGGTHQALFTGCCG